MMKTRFRAVTFATVSILVLLLLFGGCVDLTTRIEINRDGSGRVELGYSVARAVANLGTVEEDNRFYTIPVSEDDFEAAAERVEGLSLVSFRSDEDLDTLSIEATLDFDSVTALSALFNSSGPGSVEMVESDGTVLFRYVIYGGAGEEIDPESRELIETFFSDNSIELSLEAPGQIEAVNIGDFSGDEARATLAMTDILFSQDQIVWEVSW
jgi:hypothetical protein